MKQVLNSTNNKNGFTFVEIAFVILISGLITMVLVRGTSVMSAKVEFERQQKTTVNIQRALETASRAALRYPCPADPSIPEGNPARNYESWNCRNAAVNPNLPPAGSFRLPNDDRNYGITAGASPPPAAGAPPPTPVIIGIVPKFIFMGGEQVPLTDFIDNTELNTTNLKDKNGNDYIYAVTQSMTNIGFEQTVGNDAGEIAVLNRNGTNVAGTNGNAHFVVFSAGDNRCPTPADIAIDCALPANAGLPMCQIVATEINQEWENCDGDAVFSIGPTFEQDINNFDDVGAVKISENKDIWNQITLTLCNGVPMANPDAPCAAGTTQQTYEDYIIQDDVDNIGINVENPLDKIHVDGQIIAEKDVTATMICDSEICARPESLFSVECDDDEAMIGIQIIENDFQAECVDVTSAISNLISSGAINISCPNNRTLVGFTTDGQVTCNP